MSDHPSTLIICESRPHWARLFRPLCEGGRIEIREVRGLHQARQALQQAGGGVAACQVTADNLADCLSTIRWMKHNHVSVVIAILPRELDAYAWRLREFGADQIICSPLDLQITARVLRRYLRRREPAHSQPPRASTSFRDVVWRRLPWKRHAAGGGQSQAISDNEEQS